MSAIVRPSSVRRVAVEQVLLEQLAHHQLDATRVGQLRCAEAATRPHVGDQRRPLRDPVEVVDLERDEELGRDREQVQHAVGRATGRGDHGDRVLDRVAVDDLAWLEVLADEVHDQLAAAPRGLVLARVLGRDAVEAGGGEAQRLQHHRHRIGGVLAAACTRAGARPVLDLVQLLERDLARPVRADRLVDADDVELLALVGARIDGAVVEDHGGQIESRRRHRCRRIRLVTADQADQPVEQMPARDQLDRVRHHLAADERGLHSLRAHGHAVRHGDRVELHRRSTGRADALLHELREPPLVVVAGHRLDPGRRDADDRLGEIVVREAHRLEHRAGAGALGAVCQRGGVALARVDRRVVGQGRSARVGHRVPRVT